MSHVRLSSRVLSFLLTGVVAPVAVSLAGCSDPATPDAGAPDADAPDAASVDAATPVDVGVDAGDPPLVPLQVCPGSAGCMMGGSMLEAGAGARTITPVAGTYDGMFVDVNTNGRYDPTVDEIPDSDGDGRFDPAWIAGYGRGRPGTSVRDDQWARAIALRNGDVTMVFLAMDCVGLFADEGDRIRAALPASLGVDYVSVSATHTHEARDTVGIWGATISDSGYDDEFMDHVRAQAVAAITEAVERLEPAQIQFANFHVRDIDTDPVMAGVQPNIHRFWGDNRDPQIIDDQIRVMRLIARDGSAPRVGSATPTATIATLVNFSSHPEYLGSDNLRLSSDIAHDLRDAIENGTDGPDADTMPDDSGLGGIAVFINGPVGSQMGPHHLESATFEGTSVTNDIEALTSTVGAQLGHYVLRAVAGDFGGVTTLETAELGFRRAQFTLKVENTIYHVAFRLDLVRRRPMNFDPARRIDTVNGINVPDLLTEIAIIDVGPAQIITIPGELDPLLFVGLDNDRAYTPPGRPVVDTTRENPPRIAEATGPYLLDLARADARTDENVWLFGLTNDFIGYLIPAWDYELAAGSGAYIGEAPGSHYQETNSLGPHAWPRLQGKLVELLAYEP